MVELTRDQVRDRIRDTEKELNEIKQLVKDNIGKYIDVTRYRPFSVNGAKRIVTRWKIEDVYKYFFTVRSLNGQKSSFQYIDIYTANHTHDDRFEFGVA